MDPSKVGQLQLLQQNLEAVTQQKHQLETELTQLTSATKELQNTTQSYRIVGKLMVATPKETLLKELEEKKETLQVRLQNFTRQQEKLQESIKKAQEEAVSELKEDQNE